MLISRFQGLFFPPLLSLWLSLILRENVRIGRAPHLHAGPLNFMNIVAERRFTILLVQRADSLETLLAFKTRNLRTTPTRACLRETFYFCAFLYHEVVAFLSSGTKLSDSREEKGKGLNFVAVNICESSPDSKFLDL